MKFILGKKEGMSQIFDESGKVIAGTVVLAGPVTVTEVKTENDAIKSIQVGYGDKKLKNIAKPQRAIAKTVGQKEGFGFTYLKQFSSKKGVLPVVKVGDSIDVSTFAEGDTIEVSAISKGKGFQGVVKRHHFEGGRRSHGQKHSEREAGSIGAGGKQKVLKGLRMAGRMGGDRITVRNLKVVKIDQAGNQLFISGAIPGRKGTLVEIVSR